MNDIIKLLDLEDPNVIISSVNVQDGCKEITLPYFASIPIDERKQVRYLICDMYNPYLSMDTYAYEEHFFQTKREARSIHSVCEH